MPKYFSLLLTGLLLLLTSTACERRTEEAAPVTSQKMPILAKVPFREAIEPVLYELPSGALATWREFAEQRPALILFSTHPLLEPVAEERAADIGTLLQNATAAEIVRRGQLQSADTLFLSPETVSIALANGYFSEIVVVLPSTKGKDDMDLTEFKERARPSAFFTEPELDALTLNDGVISGTVRGIPLRIAHVDALPAIDKPAILHLDLGYFSGLYVNEVKTPSYQLLYNTAIDIRDAGFHALAVTLSFSNQEVEFSLESRFLVRDFADLLRKPQLLDTPTPKNWEMRAAALYAATMFDESRSRQMTAASAEAAPGDAAALFALSLDQFEQQHNNEAFATLDRAVTMDKGYALAYLELAEQGLTMGHRDKSLELLGKASAALPDLPFIRIEQSHLLIQTGRVSEARSIIRGLQQMNWSPEFHSQIPELLTQMAEAAETDPVPPPTDPAESEKQTSGRSLINRSGPWH